MPDFDVDFDERRRDEVIAYVKRKYGEDRISQVVTYGTIKTKQALKDSARILGKDFKVGEQLTKALPPAIMGKDITVHGIFDEKDKRYAEASEFRKFYEENPRHARGRPVRARPGGTDAPVGRARLRGHHELPHAHRHHPRS